MKVYAYFPNNQQAIRLHQVLEVLQDEYGWGPFGALVPRMHHEYHLDWIREEGRIDYERLDIVEEVEREALSTEADEALVDEWEEKLSTPLTQLIVADRNIGASFVKGALPRRSPLAKQASHEDMKRLAGHYLSFFDDVLNGFEPDLVFTTANACLHSAVLLHLANHEGVPHYNLRPARIPNRHVLARNSSRDHQTTVEERATQLQGTSFEPPEDVAEYLSAFRAREPPDFEVPGPGEATEVGGVLDAAGEVLRRFREWPQIAHDRLFDGHRRQKSLRTIVEERLRTRHDLPWHDWDFDEAPAGSDPYVLFPLQRTPEQSTMVLAPNFTDQRFVVELLAKNVPLNHELVVKEHPAMERLRPRGFYEEIDSHPNVRLVGPGEDMMRLIDEAALVAVITSTAGWEAQLLETPVVNLGPPHYVATGIPYRCTDPQALGETMLEAIREGPPLEEDDRRERLTAYATALFEKSIRLPSNLFWGHQEDERAPEIEGLVEQFADYFADKVQTDLHASDAADPARPAVDA